MMRVFNAREGINRNQDKLPEKFFNNALKGGPAYARKIDYDQFKNAQDEYYRQSGWNMETGTPTRQTLNNLELGWLADNLDL